MQAWPTPSLHVNSLTAICVGTFPFVDLLACVAYSPHEHTICHQDILVQRRRAKKAAKPFFREPLKGLTCVPRVVIDDPELPDVAGDHRPDHGRV
jgi:hypothetical protein